jgi:hypothetical protein
MILGLFGKKSAQAPFDFYKMAVHYGVCHGPVKQIRRLQARDKIFWEGSETTNSTQVIVQDELFGGFRKEGGLAGVVDFLFGAPNQVLTPEQASLIGLTPSTAPAYRYTTSLWFRWDFNAIPPGIYDGNLNGFYWGTAPTLPEIAVQVTSIPTTLNTAFSEIGPNPEANPANMIYECLVNDDWGNGKPASAIDVNSFNAAAETLFNEDFGMSMIWNDSQKVDAFIQEILDHINAVFFLNPKTGLWSLKLIRDDYNPDDLPVFGPDDLVVTSFQRESIGETINELIVTWTNPENEQEETVSLQDLANITIQGAIVSDSANYYGIRNADLAMKICARDLRQRSYPLAQLSLSVNRKAWNLVPGDVIKLNYPEYGIESLILRVFKVDYGAVGTPTVTVEATEDIFGLEASEFVTPPSTQWVDPTSDPTPMTETLVTTLPYYLIAQQITSADLNNLVSGEAVAGIFAASNNLDVSSYDLLSERLDASDNLVFENIGSRAPIGALYLSAPLSAEAVTTATLGNVFGLNRPREGTFLLIGVGEQNQEICQITSVSGPNFTINRGLLDTTPKNWLTGSRVFVFERGSEYANDGFDVEGEIARFLLRTRTSRGLLPEINAPIESQVLSNRAFLPLCPSNCRVNTVGFGVVNALLADDLNLSWTNRDFRNLPNVPESWDAGPFNMPAGQLTFVEIFDFTNTLVFSQTYNGSSATISSGSLPAVAGLYNCVFSAQSPNGNSLQKFTVTISRN